MNRIKIPPEQEFFGNVVELDIHMSDLKLILQKTEEIEFPEHEVANEATSGWRVPVNMRVRALLLTKGTVFAAGNPDPLDPKGTGDSQPGPIATGLLQGFNTQDGAMTFTHALSSPPVFDGLAAARGALYLCTVDGTLLCLSGPMN